MILKYILICNVHYRFDDPNNRQVNRELIANVLAVNDKLYDATLIKREEVDVILKF